MVAFNCKSLEWGSTAGGVKLVSDIRSSISILRADDVPPLLSSDSV
jgi:hypothetical protein